MTMNVFVTGGTVPVAGDALDGASFAAAIPAGATLVQLVGTSHPNPSKAAEFEEVDLTSVRALRAAVEHAPARGAVRVVDVPAISAAG